MTRASLRYKCISIEGSYTGPSLLRSGCAFLLIVVATILSGLNVHQMFAAEPGEPDESIERRIQELAPRLED